MFTFTSKVCESLKSLFTYMYISIIHSVHHSVYHNVHTYISQIVEISWKSLFKRYWVCFTVYSNERYNTHDVFTYSTCFSSLYLCFFQPQRCCPGSPHINQATTSNHSCGWDGGSVRLCLWCGYGCWYSQTSGCYPGCLRWCRVDGMIHRE